MCSKPLVEATVTFLQPEEGGRSHPAFASADYRPHIVLGDAKQRVALVDEHNQILEHYLGVAMHGDGEELTPGVPHKVRLTLMYDGNVDYSGVQPGACFTLREGARIVGYGMVTG
ncbi:hypothetical protein KOR34_43470 [Posidoniimonas corsicana]|uniref:Elongation factor Tu n=1 Tax=Posidoniimonas corsicana TaxID=1938618 RepID=A0A5C5UX66_9BACT|nr:hypothetical protein KOR34_43470 [Posidoniimonas corsicana]